MGTLPPEAEGVEEFVIPCLDDLTYLGNLPPQTLGPASLFGVALGQMDSLCPVVIEPAALVFRAFEGESEDRTPGALSLYAGGG